MIQVLDILTPLPTEAPEPATLSAAEGRYPIPIHVDEDGTYILPPLRIHNHDFVSWKGCRRRHKLSSLMTGSLALEPTKRNPAFWLGTGVHKALEARYSPLTKGGAATDDVSVFHNYGEAYKAANSDAIQDWDQKDKDLLESDILLGRSMLALYQKWATEVDDFTPLATEQEFSLPLKNPDGSDMWVTGVMPSGVRYRRRVFIDGKMDGVVRDKWGLLWFLEHKTYKSFNVLKLLNDHQVGIYMWAARRIYGREMAGSIYNILKKKTAVIPAVVYKGTKREAISRARTTLDATTHEMYLMAIERAGFEPSDYEGELAYLREVGWSNFFERHVVRRNPREIDEVGLRMYYEVLDMLPTLDTSVDDLRNFPNPDPLRCPWCPFLEPCLALSKGADWRGMLNDEDLFTQRASMDSTDYEEVAV